jgi:FkbM family methyltransferase
MSLNLIHQVNFSKNPVIFDVGCTICHPDLEDFTGHCLNIFGECKVYGFEPIKWQSYEEKYKNDSRVTLIKEVLSDTSGEFPFYTFTSETGISSMFYREVFYDYDECYETKVNGNTIDDLCEKLEIDKIDYLKIDTEGSEYKIVNGAMRMFEERKINNVQVEFNESCSVIDACFTWNELESFMNKFGLFCTARSHDDYLFTMKESNNE